MNKFATAVLAFALGCAPQLASAATVLTFEGQQNFIYSAPIVRSGFEIGNLLGQEQHFHEIDSAFYGYLSNGTGALLNDRNTDIFLRAVNGSAFQLSSFDIASGMGSAFTVTGYLGGNVVGTTSGTLGNFTTFAGFGSNIDRVVFNGTGGDGGFQLDNIVLNNGVAGAVPEPATWLMMLLGFGVIGFTMRSVRNSDARFGRATLPA
jgi:hypothetical protein